MADASSMYSSWSLWPRELPDAPLTLPGGHIDAVGAGNGKALRRRLTRTMRGWLTIGSAGSVLANLSGVLVSISVGAVIQQGIVERRVVPFVGWLALVVLCYLVRGLSTTLRQQSNIGGALAQHDLRQQVATSILAEDARQTRRRMPGDLLSVAITDTRALSRAMTALTQLPGQVVTVAASMITLMAIDWCLVGLTSLLIPLTVALSVFGVRPLRSLNRAERQAESRVAGSAGDLVSGFRTIQGLDAAQPAAARFTTISREALDATFRTRRAKAIYTAFVNAGVGVFTGLLTMAAAWFAISGRITSGEFVTTAGLAQVLGPPLRAIGIDTTAALATADASGDRVAELLNAPSTTVSSTIQQGRLGASRITFRDAEKGALRVPLQLEVGEGEYLGIVASVDVMMVLAELLTQNAGPTSGAVLLDGEPCGEWTPEAYRHRIIVAPHAAQLFTGTIADNVACLPVSEARIAAALAASGADQIIAQAPDGVHTAIGEGGRKLSGGERQRVALARALAQADDILVLVDPTSSVDSVTQDAISRAVRELRHGQTTILLSSSASLLAHTDAVILLGEGGAFVARGAHDELLGQPDYRAALGID